MGAHANRSVPGLHHPASESCKRFVAFLLAISDDATKRAGEQRALLGRIGQGRYRTLDLQTRKCLSCTGADTSEGRRCFTDIYRRLAPAKQRRVVSRDRAGTWSLTSVNDLREHSCSVHTKRRLQTHSRSGTLPCGRSFNR